MSVVEEFVKKHCKKCGFFDKTIGCNAEVECDEAWNIPVDVYGKTMRERVGEFCSTKHGVNSCCVGRVEYKFIDNETIEDVVLQIWNDGLQGVMYDKDDMKEIIARLKAAREGGKA